MTTKIDTFMELVEVLFKGGLGQLPVFHPRVNGAYFGNMIYEKGRLLFKDQGLLTDISLDLGDKAISWETNLLGMVCYRELLEWKSLTFYGINYCDLPTEIDSALSDRLMEIKNQNGERGFDFIGSIYRAYQLLLKHDFLPVVLLQQINDKEGNPGLAIGDLQLVGLSSDIIQDTKQILHTAVEKRLMIQLSDVKPKED